MSVIVDCSNHCSKLGDNFIKVMIISINEEFYIYSKYLQVELLLKHLFESTGITTHYLFVFSWLSAGNYMLRVERL
jgi:hypothetical protein